MTEAMKEPGSNPAPAVPEDLARRVAEVPLRRAAPEAPAPVHPDPALFRLDAPRPAGPPPEGALPRRGRRAYAYTRPWARLAFGAVDGLGGLLYPPRGVRPETIERVLLMRPDHMGDAVFSLPAIEAVRRRLPEARIDLLVGIWTRSLFPEAWQARHEVNLVEFTAPWLMRPKAARLGLAATWVLGRQLRARGQELGGPYDLAVDLRGDFQLILAARMAGARWLVGRGITGLGFALDAEAEEIPGRHQVEGGLALLEAAGLGPQETANPRLELTAEEARQAPLILRALGVDPGEAIVGVHPGAGQPEKRWPADRFARLIGRVTGELRAKVLLLGGPGDRAVGDEVLALLRGGGGGRGVVDLCGKLPDLRAFMMVASRCRAFVGNDSGPAHVAAALGVSVVCLFGAAHDPAEWGPRGPSVIVVRKRPEEVGALPPGRRASDVGVDPGLSRLEVEPVFEAIRQCV